MQLPTLPCCSNRQSATDAIAHMLQADAANNPTMINNNPGVDQEMDGSGRRSSGGEGDKQTSKRNPWGNESYSELITMAIQQTARQRATLAQSERPGPL